MYRKKRRKQRINRFWLLIGLMAGILAVGWYSSSHLRIGWKPTLSTGINLAEEIKRIGGEATGMAGRVLGEQVIGSITSRIKNLKLDKPESRDHEIILKFAVVSDSHGDQEVFPLILERIKEEKVEFLIHLGDVTQVADLAAFREVRELLNKVGVMYYLIPGDHDYNWQPKHDLANWGEIFGAKTYFSFNRGKIHFVLLDTSNNQSGVDVTQILWLKKDLEISDQSEMIFVFTHRPLASSYFPDRVDANASSILKILKNYKVTQVFSGDVHIFSRYSDPETGIDITAVGAGGRYKNPLPQYVLVTVYSDYSFTVEPKPYRKMQLE